MNVVKMHRVYTYVEIPVLEIRIQQQLAKYLSILNSGGTFSIWVGHSQFGSDIFNLGRTFQFGSDIFNLGWGFSIWVGDFQFVMNIFDFGLDIVPLEHKKLHINLNPG